ncbi:cytochrome P450 [Novosphingobium sp. P6W]|uniref:cytochrome P450 n=1 Tax=Novosphingobium sp. P6W TaxID=1609758 RepID=UPI0005C314FE|nr:cytochrome P450 [Novosphingobium sp. P6W]AXB78960.1 cytochrome P450 [Novosphingobium sp. P6W]KIS30965.1 cytochrome P450 [Novosphingobium sp. P6W]
MADVDAREKLEGFSLLDPMTQSDPFAMYEAMQDAPGIYRMPETGFYIVSRYADLRAVLTDPVTFSNKVDRASLQGPENAAKLREYMEAKGWPHIATLQRTDAPDHARYRRLVDRVFTVGRVREMTPHIEEVAHALIDGFIDRGECEFISEYAMLLPGTILAEEMGLPAGQVATFKKWADSMLAPASYVMDEEALLRNADIELEAQHHLGRLFDERRANPTGDWISALVTAQRDGEDPLTMAELQSVMSQLIGGGFESTMTSIGHALMQLLNHPDQMAKLREEPKRMKGFVEEVIRFESPTQGLRRRTTRDVELSGTLIPEGSVVIVRYGAANRDAAKFACPHMFDMERGNAGTHLAFGAGTHFCVGAVLARQEIAIGTQAILDRLEDIQLARPLVEPIHRANFLTLPLRELPIRFRAKAR